MTASAANCMRESMTDDNAMHAFVRWRKYAWCVLAIVIVLLWVTGSDVPNF